MKLKIDQYERAGRAWPILVRCAKNHETITYGELGAKLNVHHRTCRFFLAIIQDYNMEHNLPALTSLVLRKDTGKPGEGYIASPIEQINIAHREVFNFDWGKIKNPFGRD
jgi:putative restriction endonuclease